MIKVALNAEVHMNRTQSANKLKQKTILNYIEFGSCSMFNARLRMLLFHTIYFIIIHCCHSERAREASRALVVVNVTVSINLANRTALWFSTERVQLRTLHWTIPSSWSLFYINLFLEFCQEKMTTEEFDNKRATETEVMSHSDLVILIHYFLSLPLVPLSWCYVRI